MRSAMRAMRAVRPSGAHVAAAGPLRRGAGVLVVPRGPLGRRAAGVGERRVVRDRHPHVDGAGRRHACHLRARGGRAGSRDVGIPQATFGRGGRTETTLAVTPGKAYELVVGGAAGFNGGGAGTFHGGGGTDVRTGTCAATAACGLTARVLVAGGAGGGVGAACPSA